MPLRKRRVDREPALTGQVNQELRASYKAFNLILDCMFEVSNAAAGRDAGARRAWASAYFTRLCVISNSLLRILPVPSKSLDASDYWDLSSIATLARNILENCLTFYYVGIEDSSEGKWSEKLDLFNLHDCVARRAMFADLIGNEHEASAFEMQIPVLQIKINASSYLANKTDKERKSYMKGKRCYFYSHDEILEDMKVDPKLFRAWYEFLSSQAHGFPLATRGMLVDQRGDGVEDNLDKVWVTAIMNYINEYLARSLTQMLSLFEDIQDPRTKRMMRRSHQ